MSVNMGSNLKSTWNNFYKSFYIHKFNILFSRETGDLKNKTNVGLDFILLT